VSLNLLRGDLSYCFVLHHYKKFLWDFETPNLSVLLMCCCENIDHEEFRTSYLNCAFVSSSGCLVFVADDKLSLSLHFFLI
jgi:hypothetical protein